MKVPDKMVLVKDVVIPAGTALTLAANNRGGRGYVEAVVGFGADFSGFLNVQVHQDALNSGYFEMVDGQP